MPVFGFVNAGVSLSGVGLAALSAPLPLAIALGLLLGKQIGVFAELWIAVKTRLATKPRGATWLQIYAVSMLCGIGFTMSLFISGLAFATSSELVEDAKVGILLGSLLSALAGCAILRFAPSAADAVVEDAEQRDEIEREGDVEHL